MSDASRLIKPKWSLYDITPDNIEWSLYKDYIVEFTDIGGIEVDYWINDPHITMDTLYGESTRASFFGPYRTKFIYEVTEEPTITTGFGIVSEDIIQYAMIPKFTFSRDVSAGREPTPGDVIETLWNSRQYEIVDTGEEAHIFQLGKFIYELILKPYRYSEQSDTAKSLLKSPDSTLTSPITAYGDNIFIEEESDEIDAYSDVDTSVYGF